MTDLKADSPVSGRHLSWSFWLGTLVSVACLVWAVVALDWDAVIDINLTGQFLCAREAVRAFKRQGTDKDVSYAMGKIIHISSVHDVIPWAGHVNYAAAKGGIMLLMKSIAQELAPLRIRVNSVSPGAIRTPMNLEKLTTPESYRDLLSLIPYKRLGEAEDVGRAAVWLASNRSRIPVARARACAALSASPRASSTPATRSTCSSTMSYSASSMASRTAWWPTSTMREASRKLNGPSPGLSVQPRCSLT